MARESSYRAPHESPLPPLRLTNPTVELGPAFTFVCVRLVVLAAVEPPARQREAKESLSERFEHHQGPNRGPREDREDQSRIIFFARAQRSRGARAAGADFISKAAKPHAFSGNDRATHSTHARFKAISLA